MVIDLRDNPYLCFLIVIIIIIIIWWFWGGKKYQFIGYDPIVPNAGFTGTAFDWGNTTLVSESEPKKNFDIKPSKSVSKINKFRRVEDSYRNREVSDTSRLPNVKVPEISKFIDTSKISDIKVPEISKFIDTSKISDVSKITEITETTKNIDKVVDKLPKLTTLPEIAKTKNKFVSKGERICNDVMEKIYGVEFKTVRPNWLKNPETNRSLELDCYNEQLKIAVEYNGVQHYEWPNFTGQSYEQFMNQVRRDELKKRLCDRQGVYLITVPHHVKPDKIEEYIVARLPETVVKRN